MSSHWGTKLSFSIFGESHGAGIGVVLEGIPAGERLDFEELGRFLLRRSPGRSSVSTSRVEGDEPEFLSGVKDGVTTGSPISALIRNGDTRSSDYAVHLDVPRPGHADYSAQLRYGGHQDVRGGGHFSGRLTAPLCVAGGIAKQVLSRRGVTVGAHILSISGIYDRCFSERGLSLDELLGPGKKSFPVLDDSIGLEMVSAIESARAEGDSVGGRIECVALGVPGGLGEPMFGGVENVISSLVFGIPGVRGIEFGYGIGAADLRGSEHNDGFELAEDGSVRTTTNRHGGVLGGITTGMPIVVKVGFKPTPSIAKLQRSISLDRQEEVELSVKGRHDPCIVPRAVPVVESAVALALLDLMLLG
ncbi:MAG: chorismate synthase [Lentisphaerae bacterium]|nr:chorismate synthase [Lentisphaerota bacterium]